MDLEHVVADIADVLKIIDSSAIPFKKFRPGVGPDGEPQLVKLIAEQLNRLPRYSLGVKTMRTPDLPIAGSWALEIELNSAS